MNYYVLKPAGGIRFGTKWAYAEQVGSVNYGEGKYCPVCGRPMGGLEWLPPHRVKLSSAKPEKWGDFVWGAGFDLMVSSRFKELYEVEGLKGIDHFYPPAEIVRVGTRKTGDLPEGIPIYHLVSIRWNGANLDDNASEVERMIAKLPLCPYHRGSIVSLERVALQPNSWDGSDIFLAGGGLGNAIMVSRSFHYVVKEHSLTNAWLIPAENYAYREIGGWYVRDSNETAEQPSAMRGKQHPPATG